MILITTQLKIAARSRLYAIALGMILLTVIMVNIAAYEYLSAIKGAPVAALITASVNATLAVLVMFAASRIKPAAHILIVIGISLTLLRIGQNFLIPWFWQS